MGKRLIWSFVLAALAVAAALLPAVAGSETSPTITAVNSTDLYAEQVHSWSPSTVTVDEGASVTLSNPSTVPHGVRWVSGPATPACSGGVPVGSTEAASGIEWSGSCSFSQPGSYLFYCTVHGAAMRGTVTVDASGVTTITNPPPGSPIATPTPGTGAAGGAGAQGGPPGAGTTLAGSPFLGGAAHAVKLTARQHGGAVRGSVAVAQTAAHGRLHVELLARELGSGNAPHGGQLRVGQFLRSALTPGTVPFSVPLDAGAKTALKRHGRLPLSVEITLTPPGGAAVKLVRSVVLLASR